MLTAVRRRICVKVLMCLVCLGLLPLQLYAQVNEDTPPDMALPSLMSVAPGDPLVVLQLKDIAEVLALVEDSNVWQQVKNAPFWEMVWAYMETESEVLESQRLVRPSLSLLSHLFGHEALFVLPKFRGVLEAAPTLLLQIDRSDDLGEILAAGIEVGLANVPDVQAREYGGYSYWVTPPTGPNLRLAFGLFDNLFVASLGEAMLKKVVDLYKVMGDATESLANDAAFAQHLERFQVAGKLTDFQSMCYIDVATVLEFGKLMYPMGREQVPAEMQPLADQAVNWLDLVKSVTAVSNLTEEGLVTQSYTELNPNASADNFLAMLQAAPIAHESIKYAPADTTAYASSNLIDLPALWKMAMGVIASLPPEMKNQVESGLAAIETQLNINLERDLFSWMGKELSLINYRNRFYIPNTEGQPDPEQITRSIPDLAIAIQTIDTDLAREKLTQIIDVASMVLASMGIVLEWQPMEYNGAQIQTAEIAGIALQPGYVITDGYVLISASTPLLQKMLDCAAGRADNFTTAKTYRELRQFAPDATNSISYTNVGLMLTRMLDEAAAQLPAIAADGTPRDRAVIEGMFMQLQGLVKAVAQAAVGQIEYTVQEENGLRGYSLAKYEDIAEDVAIPDPPEAQIARSLMIAERYMDKGMDSRAHKYIDRVLELDESMPEALMMKVELLENEGNEKRADWYRRRLGFVPETAWHVIGIFDNADNVGFDQVYPPETEINLEATYDAGFDNPVGWEKLEDDNETDGFVNLAEFYAEEWSVAYAAATVSAPERQEVELRAGSDDDIKVWVNGVEVLTHHVAREAGIDQDKVHVTLNQGENRVLVKVCNRELDWGFYLRITDEAGRPIEGLVYAD